MKHTLFFLFLSLSLLGCSASNSTANTSKSSVSKQVQAQELSKRHDTYLRGVAEEAKGNYSAAIKYYTKAANINHFMAKTDLGALYYNKLKDYKNAFFWTKQVTDSSPDINANYNLAQMYRLGLGVKTNYKKAFQSYKIAEKMGSVKATSALGLMYEKGQGVKTNKNVAHDYYIEAAAKGDSFAMNNLGVVAYKKNDYKQARRLFEKAAKKGNKLAIGNLALLNSKGQ